MTIQFIALLLTANPAFSVRFLLFVSIFIAIAMLIVSLYLLYRTKLALSIQQEQKNKSGDEKFSEYTEDLNSGQIDTILSFKKKETTLPFCLVAALTLASLSAQAQSNSQPGNFFAEPGVIITIVLLLIPLLAGLFIMIMRVSSAFRQRTNEYNVQEAAAFADYLRNVNGGEELKHLEEQKERLEYRLTNHELAADTAARDAKGYISNIKLSGYLPFVKIKKKSAWRPPIDPQLTKLILAYLCCAAFWLVLGTSIGEYLGIKFVSPDVDHVSWLSFGRLRPVHTNIVFWGWASMAMMGLGYYVVPRVSDTTIASLKLGWCSFYSINAAVVLGSIFLMAGINNGGGEYREYIWPVMALFGAGVVMTLINFLRTVARRTTKEIYVSSWYIVSALMFVLVITTVAYLPWWQDGLGETIVQGYSMHQSVGMWFMFFTLGLVYYFLPQQLNKPIYSYSLGILAFWAQILFYTLVGTHHFVFSSIPWWLQTTAIVGSIGMIIPVGSGFTNFMLTFKGAWHKLAGSYTLPFFLVGIIFYFTASMQGTAEAFRNTNLVWHFTDFTVAHSHLTMYGIISFFMWAGIYSLVPRLTGKEAPQITIGAHFWLALLGLLFYTVPLMYGATLKGLLWMEGKPFTDGLTLMAPYWLWRAIGGSLMWLSHLFFAFNLYKMVAPFKVVEIGEAVVEKLTASNQKVTSL